MKGSAILLLLVICLVCIGDSDAWRRRRWRRIFRTVGKVIRTYKTVKLAAAVVGKKRDTEGNAFAGVSEDDRCQISFYDKNKDQKLSEEEMESILQNPDVFHKFDVDGDGHVDEDEFSINVGLLVAACQNW